MNLDVTRFLEDLSGRYARPFTRSVHEMIVAAAMGDRVALSDARSALERVVRETMGMGEVLGASIALRRAAAVRSEMSFSRERGSRSLNFDFAAPPDQTIVPRVTFTEALAEMVERAPVAIRRAAERTAQRISELYGEARVFAAVRSAEQAVTERVQSLVTEAIREGIPEASTGRLIRLGVDAVRERTAPWAESYSRMVFRTNLNTAVAAGNFRQAADPDIRAVIPAFRFTAVMDSDTRENHAAADGIIMRTDSLEWRKIAPPLGYNCRCTVDMIGEPELHRMGRLTATGDVIEDRVPRGAFSDPGFRHGGRPDIAISQELMG